MVMVVVWGCVLVILEYRRWFSLVLRGDGWIVPMVLEGMMMMMVMILEVVRKRLTFSAAGE